MDREEIVRRLTGILTSKEFGSLQLDVSSLTEETSLLNEAALDSLQLLELVVAIEKSFGFKANTKRLNIDMFDRFGRIVDFVEASLPAAPPPQEEGVYDGRTA